MTDLNFNRITITDNTDMPIIDIRDWKGVFTDGDVEDIPENMLTELKNLRPYHGRLIKTHGFGVKLSEVTAEILDNLTTYINSNMISNNNLFGSVWIGVYVHNTTHVVTLYGYDKDGTAWQTLNTLTDFVIDGTYYHANAKNPVFSYNKNIRFLPGNVSEPYNSNEAKGIWVGYIGYDLFDGTFETTRKFYDYDAVPEKPDSGFRTVVETDYTGSDSATNQDYYYKFSYVYDGNQEGLLGDVAYHWNPSAVNKMLRFYLRYLTTAFNMRITGIKLYRATSLNGTYELLTYIDLLRQASDVLQEPIGAYDGVDWMCIPDLTGYTFDTDYNHLLSTDAGTTIYPIEGESAGEGNTVFNYKAAVLTDTSIAFVDNGGTDQITDSNSNFLNKGFNAGDTIEVSGGSDNNGNYTIGSVVAGTITLTGNLPAVPEGAGDSVTITAGAEASASDDWDDNWKLYRQLKVGGAIAAVAGQSSTDGGNHWGVNTIIVPTAYTDGSLIGSIIMGAGMSNGFAIIDNYDKSIHSADEVVPVSNADYQIAKPSIGLYLSQKSGFYSQIFVWDTLDVTPSGEHPFPGEVSIKVNGKFAEMISGRLWQANIVLDPGGKGEVHDDWASYSELYQPDVNPVSNAQRIVDREGGEITGLAQVFGNPVFLKKQAIVRLDVTIAPGTPSTWKTIESPHNIGNIAPYGYITVLGNLYIVYYDGIYRIKPSNYSITDSTPTENLRISDPITDTFENMTDTEKTLVRCEYDQNLSEILFIFPMSAGNETWAFNIDNEQWREIETARTLNQNAIFALDEVADVMVYDASDRKVYTLNVEEDVDIQFNTKTFPIAFKRSKLVKYLTLRYRSGETIALNVYSDIMFAEGNLIMGKEYRIHGNSGGLDMTNIGAANNNVGTEFTAAIVMTATTISFQENTPSADTITDSASNFLNKGFLAGDTIVVTGDSDNNGTYTIDTVIAGIITLIGADDLTEEVLGDSVTITGSVTERAPTSWGTGSVVQISAIATKTLPVHPEAHNETVYIGRWVKEFRLQFATS